MAKALYVVPMPSSRAACVTLSASFSFELLLSLVSTMVASCCWPPCSHLPICQQLDDLKLTSPLELP